MFGPEVLLLCLNQDRSTSLVASPFFHTHFGEDEWNVLSTGGKQEYTFFRVQTKLFHDIQYRPSDNIPHC